MGDVIHTLPAVQALRAVIPKSKIGWLIDERWSELLCAPGAARRGARSPQRPLVDELHTANLKHWRGSLFELHTIQGIAKLFNDVRGSHYDVAIDLQGALRSALLARWSGSRVIYGAAEPRESAARLWYTRSVITRGTHVIEQNLSIAEAAANQRLRMPRVEFPVDAEAEARIGKLLSDRGIAGFALMNPGAGWGAKRWPAERYGEVARRLACRGVRTVINFGPGEEEIVRDAEQASAGAAVPISTSISELIALTRRARIFIGGDTGPLHLAAALQIPVIAIFGPTDPARNGPFGTRSIVLRSPQSVTSHARIAEPEAGILRISSDDVATAALQLLDPTPGVIES